MQVETWAEIHRLKKIDGLSNRAIGRRLGCCVKTVAKALRLSEPPTGESPRKGQSKLNAFKPRIRDLLKQYPDISAVRILEEITKCGYDGKVRIVRAYVRQVRPKPPGRVYLEAHYEPGEALQVDWGDCGTIRVGQIFRRLYVFVAVLCFSRLVYIEFTLSQRKEDFYRCIVNTLRFIGSCPRRIIVDNLKAAVVEGAGRTARFHRQFLALCGHYLMEPIACARRDPQSKGRVEDAVRYVKRNALSGYDDVLTSIHAYHHHARWWRDHVANVRIHGTTRKRPVDLFEQEKPHLRALPEIAFDTDIVSPVVATPMARVRFDCNRYSVPPALARKALTMRVSPDLVRIFDGRQEVAHHLRCFDKNQLIVHPGHRQAALALRKQPDPTCQEQEFDGLGLPAQRFRAELHKRPLRPAVHMRRILRLVQLYGDRDVLEALDKALAFGAIDAAYVENIVYQERRRRNLPSPTPLRPVRSELLDDVTVDPADPSEYDRLFGVE